jgi:nucleoid-associated protein YgaU
MSGTSKAIVSICVLLLAALVVYYGMTPPEPSDAQIADLPKQRPSLFGGNPEEKLIELGIPPIATELVMNSDPAVIQPIPVAPAIEEVAVVEEPIETTPVEVPIVEQVFRTYEVQEGETLGEIASRELGSYRMWREIAAINNITDPISILPGRVLRMPVMKKKSIVSTHVEVSDLKGVQIHIIEEGDTLSSIAGEYYGNVNKYGAIEQANPTIDPNRLKIGTRLVIP